MSEALKVGGAALGGFALGAFFFMVIRLPVTKNASFLPQAPSPFGGPQ